MNKKIFYIGGFAPPYGGVTIKNKVLFNELTKYLNIDNFNTSKLKKSIWNKVKLMIFLLKNKGQKGVICVSSYSLFKLTRIITMYDSRWLGQISVFAVGGRLHELIHEYHIDISRLNKYKNIYVECEGMKSKLKAMGMNNVDVIPNLRNMPGKRQYKSINNKKLKALFLSRICKEKGVEEIISAAKLLDKKKVEYKIDFYGPIDSIIEKKFNKHIEANEKLSYKGLVNSSNEDIYDLIKEYDVILFPTKHNGEGFPGIFAEAKIAGVPIIASNWNYNSDIINNLKDGIILKNNTAEELSNAIQELANDNKLREELRKNSFASGEKYFVGNYIQNIINNM